MIFKEDNKHKKVNGKWMKLCSTCKDWHPVEEFSNRNASSDGLAYSCKTCERATAAKSYAKSKQKVKAKNRYLEHREEIIDRSKARYEANKEKILAKNKEWRQSAVGIQATREATKRRYDLIKKQTPGGRDYNKEQIIQRDSSNGTCICQICFKPIMDLNKDLQIDHIIPVAEGGADKAENVRCTHKLCNIRRPKDGRDLNKEEK